MDRRSFLRTTAAALATATLPIPAFAAFPERPIKLLVPFSPGGATDVVGRLWAEKMKGKFGTVVVENKGGGGGVIGATEVARSAPNGETLLFGNTSTQVIIPAIAEHPPYDPVKDFQAVYIMAISPTSIVVHESVPVHTLKELIDYARANPTKLSYGSAGAGTMTNLSGELFKELIGVPTITHIPYKGSAPGVTDLAAGHIPMMTPNVGGPLLQLHAQGKVRILAIAANKRLQAAPDIPTAIEAGLPGMVAANFNGLFAPAHVPNDIVKALGDETRTAMADPKIQELLVTSGFEPVIDSGPDQAQHEVESEYARWTPIIKKLGFKVQ
jgi:tripartite-type tricarboxylate transporter receptor subunit TctC